MITRVQVKNFRNLADVDVQLGPLTVLVGRNGTGKSTFLDVLRFVRDALRLGLDTAISQRGGIGAIRRWSSQSKRSDIEISLDVEGPMLSGVYSFVIAGNRADSYSVQHERCEVIHNAPPWAYFETRNGKWLKTPSDPFSMFQMGFPMPIDPAELMLFALSPLSPFHFGGLRQLLLDVHCYSLFPNILRRPQNPNSERILEDHGENLTTVLRQIRKSSQSSSDLISVLSHVVEGVTDFRTRQVGNFLIAELQHQNGSGKSAWFELDRESDGTIRVLGLLAALYQQKKDPLFDPYPAVTAVEEPELALHPGALAVLSEVIKEAATRTQVLITTQSPDLISHFGADQLRVVERVDGQTRIGPIDEVQREVINDQLFSAGDLLRIEGLHVSSQEEAVASHA